MAFDFMTLRLPSSLAPVATVSLLALLLIAAGFDIAQRKVPNILVVSGLAMAFSFAVMSGWSGLGRMAMGSLAALVVLLPVYASGLMGAGDVKLISVVGGFLGLHHLLFALLCIFIAGGLLTVFYMVRTQFAMDTPGVPYAVAVFGGVLSYLLMIP